MLVLAAAGLAGCASTQTASLRSAANDITLLEKTAALLRGGGAAGSLTDADADTVMALAIAEHEMRTP
jgi:hypothetical protein